MDISKIAKQLGSRGGKKSVEKRFSGKSKEEISEIMRKVRLSYKEKEQLNKAVDEMIEEMRSSIR